MKLLSGNKAIRTATPLFIVVSTFLTEITTVSIVALWSSFSSVTASTKDLSTAFTFASLLVLLFRLTLTFSPELRELDNGLNVLPYAYVFTVLRYLRELQFA